MGHKTLARQKAIGAIGAGRVQKLDAAEQAKLIERRAELESENTRLRREQALVLVGEIVK